MAFYVDKYRPKQLDKLTFHSNLNQQLMEMSMGSDMPHLMFYGPSGAGKKTRILAFLKQIFGSGAEKLKIDQKTFSTPSGKKLDIQVISSNHHIELNPSDVGIYDRIVVQEVIKVKEAMQIKHLEIAQTQQIDSSSSGTKFHFKVVVLNEADKLSVEAQHGLRRTMEKYISNLRIIMCCTSICKIIPPIRSRCLLLRVPAPSIEQITAVMNDIAKAEGFNFPAELPVVLSEKANRNLRSILLMFEVEKAKNTGFQLDQIEGHDWQVFIDRMAVEINEESSPERLLIIRKKLYELLTHCVPPTLVLKTLLLSILKLNYKNALICPEICQAAAEYDYRMQCGSKAVYHLEAFVAKVMSLRHSFVR